MKQQSQIKKGKIFIILAALSFCFVILSSNKSFADPKKIDLSACFSDQGNLSVIFESAKNKEPDAVYSLSDCLKNNHKLIFQLCLIDPAQLSGASEFFQNNENFIYRLVKVRPEIMKYISPTLRKNKHFVKIATYLNRDSLQYADSSLLDSAFFMEKMIDLDSKNYVFASNRVKAMKSIATKAFADNGMLIAYAPNETKDDKNLAKIAISSSEGAFDYLSDELKSDNEILSLANLKRKKVKESDLKKFITDNYFQEDDSTKDSIFIDKQKKIFKKNQLVENNYISKWQSKYEFIDGRLKEELNLTPLNSRNLPDIWEDNFKKYPNLSAKVKKFLTSRHVSRDVVESLHLTYLWKVKEKPLTLAFNLYLLRDSFDKELGEGFSNVNSLTAIVQDDEKSKEWKLTVVDVIFDKEVEMKIDYKNGHKKYFVQDLYLIDKDDKNPKIIFRIEDRFKEYFQVFEEDRGGKYRIIFDGDVQR